MSTAQLLTKVTEQTSVLVRDEMALAKTEIQETVKNAGVGRRPFRLSGFVALYGVGALVAAAILGIATAVPAWLAALLVGVALFAVAGAAALLGRKKVSQATPPLDGDQAERQAGHGRTQEGARHDDTCGHTAGATLDGRDRAGTCPDS